MLFAHFRKNCRGSIAPTFAIALIPVFGLMGAAVDYSRANSVRTSMQAALDATALAMAKSAPGLTSSQLQTQTTAYFNSIYNNLQGHNVSLTPTYTSGNGSQLVIRASASVDMAFMRILGFNTVDVGTSSTIKWGNMRLRVALV